MHALTTPQNSATAEAMCEFIKNVVDMCVESDTSLEKKWQNKNEDRSSSAGRYSQIVTV